jgi:hypothetical protein
VKGASIPRAPALADAVDVGGLEALLPVAGEGEAMECHGRRLQRRALGICAEH